MPYDTPIADPISYERDIAPLTRRHFSDAAGRGADPHTLLRIARQGNAMFGEAMTAVHGMQEQELGIRSKDLAVRRGQWEFEEARRRVREERELLETVPSTVAALEAILSDEEASPEDKQQALGIWGVQNAGILHRNPAARAAYDAAQGSIGRHARSRDRYTLAANIANSGVPLDLAPEEYGEGVDEQTLAMARHIREAREQERRAQAAQEHEKRLDSHNRRAAANLSGILKEIRGRRHDETSLMELDRDQREVTQVGDFKDEADRTRLLLWLARVYPEESPESLQAKDDRELLRMADEADINMAGDQAPRRDPIRGAFTD